MSKPLPTAVRTHLTALRALLVLTVLLGIAYPLLVTGISQLAFADKANGSIVKVDGKEAGSSLLGQNFNLPKQNPDDPDEAPRPDPQWFQPRPGAYDPKASGASNLGPNSEDLAKNIEDRRQAVAAFDGVDPASVPVDALTASGSGLDPHISTAYAQEQVERVAKARNLPVDTVRKLVDKNTDGRPLGFLGQPGVNVVLLNKALVEQK
ncbi:potassium-transporting ATPase subunit KdpC [Kitasatospora purpeofusca]|uniref:potassium-transporting ATPase subunit KdpC n=1 Tax=Kitasatospora purpeofusca TaxID=67352 RepID=UPI002255E014|nr:potassium-transporting ATPase subunit KdpC [Kitasatospora purpeofusca]MCX4753374.1 potassium-transporting ATPase subunit KdpC [Kitasatospora purpeofusca]WSR32880.1 potassium-transporting ATPase subunit KdpC [Kitasatospora purpeofusca]WSR40973.1 potassium-transporting ATPase subunit KdpC [Kitasatospora purpeofusca]